MGTVVATVLVGATAGSGASGEVIAVPSGGALTIVGRGNGHGHGLSQYGAEGAAIAGLSANQIVAFYYPGTTPTTIASKTIRVRISDDGGATTVLAKPGLSVTGVSATLPTAGYTKWRLVPSGSGLALQGLSAAGWLSYARSLPATANFSAATGIVRLFHSDGTSTDYRGTVGAARSGAGELTVNRLPMDSYVEGVVPRESPASWLPAALGAQAIAARSYAAYEVGAHSGSPYDICDTSSCQVYGGMTRYSATGAVLYTDDPDALSGNANEVLTYGGSPIFAQYSASDGGATAAGGQPYLPAKVDPYDNSASGDPYLGWTRAVSANAVAAQYGLASVTQIEITSRDGVGAWGGHVLGGFVDGTDSTGTAQRVAFTGPGLAGALGLPSSLFDVEGSAHPPRGALDRIAQTGVRTVRVTGWTYDPASTTTSTQVDVFVGSTLYATVASIPRSDVQAAFNLPGNAHGFDTTVTIPAAATQVCVYGLNAHGGGGVNLGCKTFTAAVNPMGHLDSVVETDATHVQLTGWEFDPDSNGGPGSITVTANNVTSPFTAGLPRSDVQAAFGLANATVGFSVSVPVVFGSQNICVDAPNTAGAGTTVVIACRTIVVVPAFTTARS